MQILLKQNLELKKSVQVFLEEIEKQKELNAQHEKEIQTLLKFNERLLGIIENQLTNNKKDNCSLQPISQRSERESDLIMPSMQSMIKLRKFGGTKSERGGYSTNNLAERVNQSGNKLDLFNCELLQSEVDYSPAERQQDQPMTQRQNAVPASVIVTSTTNASNEVKNQITNQINDLKKFRDESSKFYDSKINQVRALSSKITKTSPLDQLNKISEKLTLSATTSNLIKQALSKAKN